MNTKRVNEKSYLMWIESVVDQGCESMEYGEWFWCDDFEKYQKFVQEKTVKLICDNLFNTEFYEMDMSTGEVLKYIFEHCISREKTSSYLRIERFVLTKYKDFKELNKALFELFRSKGFYNYGIKIDLFDSLYTAKSLIEEHYKEKGLKLEEVYYDLENSFKNDTL